MSNPFLGREDDMIHATTAIIQKTNTRLKAKSYKKALTQHFKPMIIITTITFLANMSNSIGQIGNKFKRQRDR